MRFVIAALLVDAISISGCAETTDNIEGDGSCGAGSSDGTGSATRNATDFFRSYGTAWVQAEMLQDETRTMAFHDAILANKGLFKDKVVLDVGAGTGILSFFAARAGAARVFAVERSDMALIARQIALDNGLDGIVKVIHGLLEEIVLPVEKVDIIVSEWIGTFLIHESMLDSVLYARDRWLAEDGILLPDRATLYLGGIRADQQVEDLESWKKFYGLNYSALATAWRRVAAQQCASSRALMTGEAVLLDLDLYDVSAAEQEFLAPWSLSTSDGQTQEIHALASWFSLGFFNSSRSRCAQCREANVSSLSTHPDDPCTHWAQTFFFFDRALSVNSWAGTLRVRRDVGNPRDLSVRIAIDGHQELSFVVIGADL